MEVTLGQASAPDLLGLFAILVAIAALGLVLVAGGFYFYKYFVGWIKYRDREKRSLGYVLLQIIVPKDNEIKIDAAEQLFATFASIKKHGGMFSSFKPQPIISFEIVATHES